MGKCDIKATGQAWNDGVDAFEKALKVNGGKVNPALKYAIEEVRAKHPGVDFEVSSFTDPIVSSLKSAGIVSPSFKYKGEGAETAKSKVDKIAEKMSGLNPDQKKEFARKVYGKFAENGTLDEDEVKNIYADALGLPAMDDKLAAQIEALAKALQEQKSVEDEVKEQIKKMQADKDAGGGKLTAAQNAHHTNVFNSLATRRTAATANAMKQQAGFSNMLKEKRFWLHQLVDYMALNLMNLSSLAKNVSGAIMDGVMRGLSNSIAPVVSKLMSLKTGVNSNPFGARTRGGAKGNFKERASLAWKHGITEFSPELPKANHLDAMERFRQAMDATGYEKFKGFVSAVLKVHPMLISKGLTVPDAIVFEWKKMAELNRIGEAKGLKDAELQAFIMNPDDRSLEISMNMAKDVTFKQDLPQRLRFLQELSSLDPHELSKKWIAEGNISPLGAKLLTGFGVGIMKSAIPFIKTPINIIRVASKMLLPEYYAGSSFLKAHRETDLIEKQRLIADGVGTLIAGMFIRNIVLEMVAHGLISSGYSDEDKKSKDIVEQELGGPNRVNWSALVRGLTLRDMTKQEGDKHVDLNSLGAFGIVLAAYSHAFSKYGKDEIEARTQYNRDLTNAITVPSNVFASALGTSLDFTFFTGFNQLQGAILNRQGYEMKSWAINTMGTFLGSIAPSTYQKLSTQESPEVKKQYDKDKEFHDNLFNSLGYKFAFDSGTMRNKYFSLAEKEGEGAKKKHTMFFDNYIGRVLEAQMDFVKLTVGKTGDPISRLHEAMRDVEKDKRDQLFPAAISDETTIPYRKGGKNRTDKVKLTPEQHDYLQERASTYRMLLATPFIMSEDFQSIDHDTRAKTLQAFYQEGLKYAKQDLKKKFPDVREQRVEGYDQPTVKKLTKKYKTQIPAQ